MMINIAEDLIGTARDAATEISRTMSEDQVDEYQRMISTALGCLEAAMQSQKLSPREEALVRLRYAGVIQEETEDIMEAETTLTKGITLCEKHRMQDLKYAMQYLLTKVLFQRNHKAGIKALDQHIVECDTYRHFHWAYAFRLLKHSFYTETGGFGDNAALDNIRSVYTMASERGDAAVAVYASLSEALMLIKTCKGHFEGIRTCLAQAAKYQFDPTIKIPQLELLHVLVDFLGGLQRDPPAETSARLQRLQTCSDAHQSAEAQFWIPIKKSQYESTTISKDTMTVVRPGGAGETFDFLAMAYISVNDLVLVSLVMGGTFYLHKSLSQNTALGMWERAQGILHQAEKIQSNNTRARPVPLGLAVKEREWREQVQCYLHVLFSLHHISECNWSHARDFLVLAGQVRRKLKLDGLAKTYLVYAEGAYHQGTGCFQDALACFESDCLSLHAQPSADSQRHLASLAAMNRLWIMQRPEFTDNEMTSRLMDEVDPFCLNHPNADLRGVWMAVKASITMTPPRRNDSRTTEAKGAMTLLGQSKSLGNSLGLAIALKVTHTLLFNTVLGDKAVSCLEAAKKWADFSNNPLWQSVVAGSFVELAEKGNDRDKWVKYNAAGIKAAQRAFQMS
ncbi:uncharacterized protein J7T54_001320 [Emericellopsis cladophorae]|uniref:Uncharacterized protein n=1 Tax=Emericellopsis cladophorae TaxID=2686198 RepID=A0A9P9Y3G1_9HYPO|nr:uncharacterized protein J7T54_001320 [Emericellopsis cladophorae]KAI6782463.1 hypothetical protein J7T54_001320 [Emericellopsis cladophorae]